jgi:hypothetical protein
MSSSNENLNQNHDKCSEKQVWVLVYRLRKELKFFADFESSAQLGEWYTWYIELQATREN